MRTPQRTNEAVVGQGDQDQRLNVAPIISDHKISALKDQIISTLMGFKNKQPQDVGDSSKLEGTDNLSSASTCCSTVRWALLYILFPLIVILPPSLIILKNLHALAVLIPAVVLPLGSLANDIFAGSNNKKLHKYLVLAAYGYLWAVHFFIARQLYETGLAEMGQYIALALVSAFSIFTSLSTISLAPVQQFSASSLDYSTLSPHSTLYMRFLIAVPGLLFQLALYYASPDGNIEAVPLLEYVNGIVSFVFLTWYLGWLSSFYNTSMFLINRIGNGLIFGEKLFLVNSLRNRRTWWMGLVVFIGNLLAIGLNYLVFYLVIKKQGYSSTSQWDSAEHDPQIDTQTHTSTFFRAQHITLIILCTATSVIFTLIVFLNYRIVGEDQQKTKLLRYGRMSLHSYRRDIARYSLVEVQQQNNPPSFPVELNVFKLCMREILIGLIFAFIVGFSSHQFSSYGTDEGFDYSTGQASVDRMKILLSSCLGVDFALYIILMILRETTRPTSKLGCSIHPCCFYRNFANESQRDLIIHIILRITSTISVLVIVARLTDLDTLTKQILMYTPLTVQQSVRAYNFIRYFVIPVLIYRSYKRCIEFSHSTHIAIGIAFFICLSNYTLYMYEYSLIVLAMPLFPDNPFPLLFASPFTIPKKLIHANQNCYRVLYLLVNICTAFGYFFTLGLLDLTMIFGLPMYWCVIPTNFSGGDNQSNTISDQPKQKTDKDISQNDQESLQNINRKNKTINDRDLQIMSENINRSQRAKPKPSTPQQILYERIVQNIPLNIFIEKPPGYYLIRISKYILLVELQSTYYGIVQIVKFIGLEAQEITTCHAKQGQAIDKMIEQTWPQNNLQLEQQRDCVLDSVITKVIHPILMVKNVRITAQNQIQLTGIVESSSFFQIFKQALMKSLIYLVDKKVKNRQKINYPNVYTRRERANLESLIEQGDIQRVISKQKYDSLFPKKFVEESQGHIAINFVYPKDNSFKGTSIGGGRKLPPIGTKPKNNKNTDDFLDLIDSSNSYKQEKKTKMQEEVQEQKPNKEQIQKAPTSSVSIKERSLEQLNAAYILSVYAGVVGNQNFLNVDKIMKVLKGEISDRDRDMRLLYSMQPLQGHHLAAQAVGYAFKIAVDKSLMGEEDVALSDLISYDKNQFLGTPDSAGFSEALNPTEGQTTKTDIWTMTYEPMKKKLSVKRLAETKANLYLFELDSLAVKSIWNNLRFQLLYAANDDDERYSIQTHPHLLRNLLIEACEQPYGYAGFYSDEYANM